MRSTQHLSESSQQRGDRLLAEYRAAKVYRRVPPGCDCDPVERELERISRTPSPSRWRRIRRALRPWVAGFDNPYMDALWLAFMIYFAVLHVILAAMWIADHQAPPTSGAFSADEVATRPAAIPLGGGATGEGR